MNFFREILHFYLHNPNKSSTFAAAFEKRVIFN